MYASFIEAVSPACFLFELEGYCWVKSEALGSLCGNMCCRYMGRLSKLCFPALFLFELGGYCWVENLALGSMCGNVHSTPSHVFAMEWLGLNAWLLIAVRVTFSNAASIIRWVRW